MALAHRVCWPHLLLAGALLGCGGASATPAAGPTRAATPAVTVASQATAPPAASPAPGPPVPAFAGAEGFGAFARGGRGGDVYHVTSLADNGPGSLRTGIVSATGPRTIVFDVAGTIDLTSRLVIEKPFLTIAGQTTPGGGITLRGWNTVIQKTNNVVVRYLRFRPGDVNCPRLQDDALSVDHAQDVILDHVSASWSIDEALSVTDSDRVTVQWSIIADGLRNSCHEKGAHGYGSLLRYGNGGVTFHHNLYVHNDSRNPRVGDNIGLDFVNNVIYDWGMMPGYSGEASEGTTRINYMNNHAVAGPSTRESRRGQILIGGSASTQIFQPGNVIDPTPNGKLDGTDTGWSMFTSSYTRQTQRFDFPQIRADDAPSAYTKVLAGAGASRSRDAVDQRLVADVTNGTGKLIDSQKQAGGWPDIPAAAPLKDTDQDGMPDEWETQNGLNPNDPADRNRDLGGSTALEKYLQSRATTPAP